MGTEQWNYVTFPSRISATSYYFSQSGEIFYQTSCSSEGDANWDMVLFTRKRLQINMSMLKIYIECLADCTSNTWGVLKRYPATGCTMLVLMLKQGRSVVGLGAGFSRHYCLTNEHCRGPWDSQHFKAYTWSTVLAGLQRCGKISQTASPHVIFVPGNIKQYNYKACMLPDSNHESG